MQKKFVVIVLIIIVVTMAGCLPNFIQPIQLSTSTSKLQDPVIAVEPNGDSHVAGVSGDTIVYHRIDSYGNIERTEEIESTDPSAELNKPDIAVTEDGTAWIVWIKIIDEYQWAMVTSIPPSSDFDGFSYYLDGFPYKSGDLVRVVARDDTVYAVYNRVDPITGNVEIIFYRDLVAANPGKIVFDYISTFDSGEIYSMDLAIDSNDHLHVVYHDKLIWDSSHHLRYNSNATTYASGKMDQLWEIGSATTGPITVEPKISIHEFTSGVESVIMTGSVGDNKFVASCRASDCDSSTRNKNFIPSTTLMTVTEFDILGYPEDRGYQVSFIGTQPTETYPQVYRYDSARDTTWKITDTESNKLGLSMVYGDIPVLGFIEYTVKHNPPPLPSYEHVWLKEYDGDNGLRTIFEDDCILQPIHTLDIDSALYPSLEEPPVPVAGVWNLCDETWFSTNFQNLSPFFTSGIVTTAPLGTLYTYNITASDLNKPHGDSLTISATEKPAWLTFTDNGDGTAILTGTPTLADYFLEKDVKLVVTDSYGLTDEQVFSIQITGVTTIFLPLTLK